ncbi:hypothetical protein GDO81_028793 [Engystomops pustulosus]|uniref:Uncharacterized protein n=1 Tax=Engystomops pustulosus TaxID=76066 RepID=A0AAV6YDQ1_ENGPU|nr:hypothetical protein GDO81_028793 [Engystomops pustulosus]
MYKSKQGTSIHYSLTTKLKVIIVSLTKFIIFATIGQKQIPTRTERPQIILILCSVGRSLGILTSNQFIEM